MATILNPQGRRREQHEIKPQAVEQREAVQTHMTAKGSIIHENKRTNTGIYFNPTR